jgi:hypothetical protein
MASKVSIFESAVGEEPGTSHLYIYPRNDGQSTMALRGGTEIQGEHGALGSLSLLLLGLTESTL